MPFIAIATCSCQINATKTATLIKNSENNTKSNFRLLKNHIKVA